MTHAELVARAGRWLKNTKRCGVVLTEFHSAANEVPDAIGFKSNGASILVECKTSVSDFYADKKKPGRGRRAGGMGHLRFYMTPPGLLSVDLVRRQRPGWGLLEARGRIVRVAVVAEPRTQEETSGEFQALYAYARRIHQYGLTLDEAQEAVRLAAEALR